MAKRDSIAMTCPICLGVDDPESAIRVAIQRVIPPDSVEIALCRRCAHAIAKAVIAEDEAPPPEAVSDETGSA